MPIAPSEPDPDDPGLELPWQLSLMLGTIMPLSLGLVVALILGWRP